MIPLCLPPPPLPCSAHHTCWKEAKYVLHISEGKGRGGREEAKSPPTRRMLITCVLSQAEPGHPLWIKGEIVSRLLIFHRPEMFGRSLSSGSCAREIIRAHSEQRNPSFSGCWTTSPWLLGGHCWPNWSQVLPNRTPLLPSANTVYISTSKAKDSARTSVLDLLIKGLK